jgi:hypothetical protein
MENIAELCDMKLEWCGLENRPEKNYALLHFLPLNAYFFLSFITRVFLSSMILILLEFSLSLKCVIDCLLLLVSTVHRRVE